MLSFKGKNHCEQETKFIQDRLIFSERTIAELCQAFAQYSRKVARVRDAGDELSKTIQNYSLNETFNSSLCEGLDNFTVLLSTVNDYGDLRVQNIDNKIVKELAKYEDICKHVKDDMKQIFNARDKEINRKRQLDKIREKTPRNRQQIVQAETELVKASAEVSKTVQNLEEKATKFEKGKLHDIKYIFLDFISNELGYHAKSLEILSQAFQVINNINENEDLMEFTSSFKNSLNQDGTKNSLFKAPSYLGSLGNIFSSSHTRKTPGIPDKNKRVTRSEDTLESNNPSQSESEEDDTDYSENSESILDSEDYSKDLKIQK